MLHTLRARCTHCAQPFTKCRRKSAMSRVLSTFWQPQAGTAAVAA
jgi:hypothetical protein